METRNLNLNLPEEDDLYNITLENENFEAIDEAVGDINTMKETVGATDLSDAISKVFQLGNKQKERLVSNLIAMGVQADTSETLEALIGKVLTIMTGPDTSNDTITADVLLSGYTAHGANGQLINGAMTDNGAISKSMNCGLSYTIPKGYHNGEGKVKTNSLASQTQGTAVAPNILEGETAWVNGEKITGTMKAFIYEECERQQAVGIYMRSDDEYMALNIRNAGYYDFNVGIYCKIKSIVDELRHWGFIT